LYNINNEILDLKESLKRHPLYKNIKTNKDIKIFMENHIFAVWDFMSLLKALQIQLTNVSTPWLPNSNSVSARFINEIVHGEETDLNENGIPQSHFEMYLDAMHQIEANTSEIDKLVELIRNGFDVDYALNEISIDETTAKFVKFTFEIVSTNKPHLIASAFTFGREDIIPEMFIELLDKFDENNEKYSKLRYYFARHIELDGDEHGPLSHKLIADLCENDNDKWEEAIVVARKSLALRIELWSSVEKQILKSKKEVKTEVSI
jgi:hypothetical protein